MPVTWQSNATKFGGKKFVAVVLFTTSFCKKFVVVTTNSQKTKVSSNFPNLDAILRSPIAKNNFFLFWRILKFVDTRNFNVGLHFFAYMLNFQVSLQKRQMFVWKGKDKQISLARFTSLPISLQQVNISGILRASAKCRNSEEVSLNWALVSGSDISSSVPSILS